ncbi:MAG: helix-turn-helix transcriptional regulator [Oscillospiraceae bacterium]|nr:helix-turn-helix transcriptional regulator [Oscillospiraceae bacterium]
MFYDQEKCGTRIRQIRKQNGYTQERLAEELNMDRSVLSRIEAGKYVCGVDFLAQIAIYFGISLDFLVFGKAQNKEAEHLKESITVLIRQLEQFKADI